LRSSGGAGNSSPPSLTADELTLLYAIRDIAGNDGLARVFSFSKEDTITPLIDLGRDVPVEELVERLDRLVEAGYLRAEFDAKVLTCGGCGSRWILPRTACPSCGSEDVAKSPVYRHGCGALIPEATVKRLASCPKCGEGLAGAQALESRFVCGGCATVFEDPVVKVACYVCGWNDLAKNASQLVLRKYGLTAEGLGMLLSADPVRRLARRLVSEGYAVRQGVKAQGVSGNEYTLDLVAVKQDGSETRVYMVFYRVGPAELVNSAAKRLDIEKTSIEGVSGRVRWLVAGLEIDPKVEQVADTFGIEVEAV
jgi:ribosomal protein S27AE